MKHAPKIILLLLLMFFVTQLIGLFVINQYQPEVKKTITSEGKVIEIKEYDLPYGLNPPKEATPKTNLISISFAFVLAIFLMLFLMKFKAESFFRFWFFLIITIALSVTFNAFIKGFYSFSIFIALFIAILLAFFKIYKKNILVHNLTELLIYPGIAAIIVPLLNIPTVIFLLILISVYDIYAVWYAGFMQKMAKYQMNEVKVFGGFFIPYIRKEDRHKIKKLKILERKGKKLKGKGIKVELGILGGGDVIFPLIFSGVLLRVMGLIPALIMVVFSTISLLILFVIARKGKFYPAMPFLTIGCLFGLLLIQILKYFSII